MSHFLEAVAAAIAQLSFSRQHAVALDVISYPGCYVEARFVRWDNRNKLSKLFLIVSGQKNDSKLVESLTGQTVRLFLKGRLVAEAKFVLGFVSVDPMETPVAHISFILEVNENDGWGVAKVGQHDVFVNPGITIEIPQPSVERSA